MSGNPLDEEEPEIVAKSDLKNLWQSGFGRKAVVLNVEELVNRLIEREAKILVEQQQSTATKHKKAEKPFF